LARPAPEILDANKSSSEHLPKTVANCPKTSEPYGPAQQVAAIGETFDFEYNLRSRKYASEDILQQNREQCRASCARAEFDGGLG